MKILIACSSGGHLTQALALRGWWGQHERCWATFPVEDARSRLSDEKVYEIHYPTVRNVPNLIRNFGLARRVLAAERPDVVFSTGAAIALPFFALARLYGARTVYLEPVDRVTSPGLSGRLVYPFSDEFLVQWDGMRPFYPGSRNVGVVL
ncbi:UDP-N-acetylglucosamine--LPS N-acetylglucosamine transferase [Microbacterium sp. CFBP9034]|uniref:UDP-N-acetylglucosamine--LPS N-acetylglucosamine transferase n=1 Tax=Microbacterium sp. CFBP9034 TaxID=3096540 RepID=UPI002A6A74FF|nr:UDP-N-acetylglucosamine--LPS N-acetylglucosamine transferase [Microbacterium sp. CFBP9034]MDY0907916.1 UDP-N-acetylglucosamine--LPS N-acetylglucosamine transferase [Microbacterium sp. CFBP9034]